MSRYFLACFGAALALACCSAAAQDPLPRQETVRFGTFENDMFYDTDRYYTNGIQYSVKHASDRRGNYARAYTDFLCGWLDCSDARLLASQSNFGQLMYTPNDISVRAPQPWDRPWAGLLYYEKTWTLLSPDQRQLTILSTEFGVTGRASLSEQSQKLVHRILDRDLPQGWDNQIGGSLAVLATAEQRTAREALSTRLWGDVQLNTASYWRIGVGNLQTYAAGGLAIVIGKDLPQVSPPPPGIGNKLTANARALPTATACFKVWIQCTAFGAAEARLVVYSVFLDGRLWGDDPDVERRVLVTDLTMGVRLDFPHTRSTSHGPWFAQFKVTRRSPEFRSSLISVPHHKVGALTIGTEF
jgi:lipid A 3-O-deacylase